MRHTKVVTITHEGRDKGKRFYLTEMGAVDWEDWYFRAAFIISKGGGQVPDDLKTEGIAGLLTFGLNSLMFASVAEAKPLADELLRCVQVMPDPTKPDFVRPGPVHWRDTDAIGADVEEGITITMLRKEVLELHLGFSVADKWLEYRRLLAAAAETAPLSQITPTSLPELVG